MKLLANEKFHLDSVLLLRKIVYDIKSVGEDHPSIKDKEVIAIAQSEKRIILTFDRDYGELIFKHKLKPSEGVIYLRIDKYSPDEQGKFINLLLKNNNFDIKAKLTVYDGNFLRQRKY